MRRTKDLSEDMRQAIVDDYRAGLGYKKLFKQFKVHLSTVLKAIYKWRASKTIANLPRSGQPSKVND